MKTSTAPKRKTGRMIAKNLILLLVVVLIATLAIWAWFTQNQSATADGINVKTKAEGVEVSWTGKNDSYYKDLTALNTDDIVEKQTGLAKSIDASLKLITGDGKNFFEPLLNRRTGEPLKNTNDTWKGSDVTNADGKYVEIPLYFRSTTERRIYLTGKSAVSPRSTSEQMSEYGNFSKDYICSAARVAFLNKAKDKCNFIWAPNSNYELVQSDAGFTKIINSETDSFETSGGGGNLDGGAEDDGKTYYLWTYQDKSISVQPTNFKDFDSHQFTYDASIRYFVTEFSFYVPTYDNQPTIPLIINTNPNKNAIATSDMANIKGADSKNISKPNQHFYITNTNFNIGDINCTNGMYGNNRYISKGQHMTVKFGYNPQTDILTILSYDNGAGQSFDLGGAGSMVVTNVKYYPIENNTTLALANADRALAVSANDSKEKSIRFSNSAKTNILSTSVTNKETFIAKIVGTANEEHPSKNKYTFMNSSTNLYLTVSRSNISFTDTGTEFYLSYNEGISGPVLKTEDSLYLAYVGNSFRLVTPDELTESNFVTIYTGSTYSFLTDSTATQTYEYYSNGSTACTPLGEGTTPPLFPSATTDTEEKIISKINADTTPIPVVELKKAKSTDEYATGSIVIRIWAEGTDRDALTPLAGGKFEVDLHFTSILPTNS